MSSYVLKRASSRASSGFLRSNVPQISRPSPLFLRRNATSGSEDPGASGNVANPQSSSADAANINASRATDSAKSLDNAAASRTPTSDLKETNFAESTPTHDEINQDPSKPDAVKRENVEKQREKPMGPEDNQ